MSQSEDLARFRRWIHKTDRRLSKLESGATETRPAPRFIPGSDPEPAQNLDAYLGVGWSTSGAPGYESQQARFYRDRGRVYFAGLVTFSASTPGANSHIPITSMPAGYTPDLALQNVPMFAEVYNSPVDSRQEFWQAQINATGQFLLLGNKNMTTASPDVFFPPDTTVLYLETISYRCV